MKKILFFFLLLASLTFGNSLEKLQSIEQMIEVGEYSKAWVELEPVYDALFEEEKTNDLEGIKAVRLHSMIFLEKHPKSTLSAAERLVARASENLGPMHEETIKARMLYAEALDYNEESEKAVMEWIEVGRQVKSLEKTDLNRLLANCYIGLGATYLYMEPETAILSFENVDSTEKIAPQLKFEDVSTTYTTEGTRLIEQGILLHKSIGGENDLIAITHMQNLALFKREQMADIRSQGREFVAKTKEELHIPVLAEAKRKLNIWHQENPEPSVIICTGDDAYAYHKSSCFIIDNCNAIEKVKLSTALSERKSCDFCEPPMYHLPPKELTVYKFDGRWHSISQPLEIFTGE